ncbi:GL17738 [Drosophila persimilis]|uniref:GL17738 n=1 Tax=Drosophila persimilis TaxID=7234 RepID=B4GIL7_DROPE|nr:GL17738 [Drosophila persimilis]
METTKTLDRQLDHRSIFGSGVPELHSPLQQGPVIDAGNFWFTPTGHNAGPNKTSSSFDLAIDNKDFDYDNQKRSYAG